MIEVDMEENNFSVIGLKICEVRGVEGLFTKVDNEIGLFIWWYLLHVFIVCHDPHLKNISRTKFVAKYVSRYCLANITKDLMNLLCNTRKF